MRGKGGRRLAVLAAALLAAGAARAAGDAMSVQVQNGQIRATPTFLGAVVATLSYGARVEQTARQGDWIQVRDARNRTGWMHESALTRKKLAATAGEGGARMGATSDELSLAGKGFNSDVESQFKSRNQNVDFTWVDRMEAMKVAPRDSAAFLSDGAVAPAKGGAR